MLKFNIQIIFLLFFLPFTSSFIIEDTNTDGLSVTFKKLHEDYLFGANYVYDKGMPIGGFSTEAYEGYKFVSATVILKNNGSKDCIFMIDDFHLSTEQDSLYPTHTIKGYNFQKKIKIKPGKDNKELLLFQIPDKSNPKELFIDDKRFKVVITKKN